MNFDSPIPIKNTDSTKSTDIEETTDTREIRIIWSI